MKKTRHCFLLFIIFLLLFSGCDKKVDERPEIELNELPVIVEENELEFNLILTRYEQYQLTPSEIKTWNEYVKKEFRMDINLVYATQKKYEETIKEIGYNGLVFVENLETLKSMAKKDFIIPLNEIIDHVKETKVINRFVMETLTDHEGDVWGLPAGNIYIIKVRQYNQDWLSTLNLRVPETIEEFYDCAVRIASEDLDENGISDSYIARYTNETLTEAFYDIFLAFGCYPDSKSSLVEITYHPETKKYENMVFSENFREAMLFIKSMKDNKLIINREQKLSDFMYSKAYGEHLLSYYTNSYNNPFENTSTGLFLTGTNDQYLVNVDAFNWCFAILKNTENGEDIIRQLVSKATSYDSFSMALDKGVPGYNYYETEDAYMLYKSDDINEPGIYNFYKKLSKPAVYEQTDLAERTKSIQKGIEIENLINEKTSSDSENICFATGIDHEFTINNVTDSSSLKKLFLDLVTQVLDEGVDIDDAISTYIMEYQRVGLDQKVEQMNERLN